MPGSTRDTGKPAAGAAADADGAALTARVRAALPAEGRSEQRMFGGTAFLLHGNMLAAASKRGLLLRVGKDAYAAALARPGARAMEMRGRPMAGYVYVDPAGLGDAALRDWLRQVLAFVGTLPPKSGKGARI